MLSTVGSGLPEAIYQTDISDNEMRSRGAPAKDDSHLLEELFKRRTIWFERVRVGEASHSGPSRQGVRRAISVPEEVLDDLEAALTRIQFM